VASYFIDKMKLPIRYASTAGCCGVCERKYSPIKPRPFTLGSLQRTVRGIYLLLRLKRSRLKLSNSLYRLAYC